MKLIIFSDIQFNNWGEFAVTMPNGLNSRFQDQLNALDTVFEFAKQQKNGDDVLLVHNGDLFESMTEKIDKQVFLTVYEKFAEFSKNEIPVVLLIGNHDWVDKTETSHMVEPFKEIENVLVVSAVGRQEIGGTSLSFIPYTRDNFKGKVTSLMNRAKSKSNYLFTHQGVNGAKVGPRDIPLKDTYSPEEFGTGVFNIVFNGHYHKHQRWGNFWIVGSPVQKDFGEREDRKGFLFLDTGVNPNDPQFIDVTIAPRFFKIQVNKAEDLCAPAGCCHKDFLWVVSTDVSREQIIEFVLTTQLDLTNVRIEIEQKREQRTRTDISLNMAIEDQVQRAIEFMQHQLGKAALDKDILVSMAMDYYRRSQT